MDVTEILQQTLEGKIIFCSSAPNAPGEGPEPGVRLHKHPGREIVLSLEGEEVFCLQNRNYHLTPGMAVLIDSWMPHSFGYAEKEHGLLDLWIHFEGNQASCNFCRVGMHGHYDIFGVLRLPSYLCLLLNSRWNEWKRQDCRTDGTAERYLLSPLRCLLEEVMLRASGHSGGSKPFGSDLVLSLRLYIESRNACDCSLENLEKVFGYSRFYLAHKFSEVQGMPLGAYINEVRLAFTQDALMKGLKQKEIAYELGFSSSAAFSKWFRLHRR
ncbi:MAG: AraC family transcriptional regulator [Victivallales bacterium]|nr:AraC family transcriptional regulator [Victivallales bacterium]